MYVGNPGEMDFGSGFELARVRVIESQLYVEWSDNYLIYCVFVSIERSFLPNRRSLLFFEARQQHFKGIFLLSVDT